MNNETDRSKSNHFLVSLNAGINLLPNGDRTLNDKNVSLLPAAGRTAGLLACSLVAGVLLMLNAQRHNEPNTQRNNEPTMNSQHGWPLVYLLRESSLMPLRSSALENVYAWPFPAQDHDKRTFSLMNGLSNLICAVAICALTYTLASRVAGRKSALPTRQQRKQKGKSKSSARTGNSENDSDADSTGDTSTERKSKTSMKKPIKDKPGRKKSGKKKSGKQKTDREKSTQNFSSQEKGTSQTIGNHPQQGKLIE